MKSIFSLLCLFGILTITKASAMKPGLCTDDNIKNLAACCCFVQSTLPGMPVESIEVCKRVYGDDLLSLKPHCKNFMTWNNVVVDKVTGAVETVKKECLSQLLPAMAATRVGDDELEHVSERWVPVLIGVVLLLYAPSVH